MGDWKCPRCKRAFRQVNQRHSCGVGDRATLLSGKSAGLVELYRVIEREVSGYPGVEIVSKDRYALFRTTRIFADLVFMKDALRLALQLERVVVDPLFFKTVHDRKRVAHVAKLCTAAEVAAVLPYLKEAYELARGEPAAELSGRRRPRGA
jgi:hypothetical protein